ncbi:hypothetical protein BG011_009165 [Mortierella polycephala]|uniref:N-acetyltransferase domain-containing protein n=1 Tax=Mortierella polycephala TaxID=41804 RepID=A0A9P6QH78_9FUNG|nr:hypothetical protein BG011_009165 [Mortierella polycephala]
MDTTSIANDEIGIDSSQTPASSHPALDYVISNAEEHQKLVVHMRKACGWDKGMVPTWFIQQDEGTRIMAVFYLPGTKTAVGMGGIEFQDFEHSDKDVADIESKRGCVVSLFLYKQYRGQGYLGTVLKCCEEMGRSKGLEVMTIYGLEKAGGYERFGYRTFKMEERSYGGDNRWMTRFLEKPLIPSKGADAKGVDDKFYIQGGATSADNLLQGFWALDLTTPWTTSNPAWKSLPLGPFNAYHSAGYSADNKTFITFGRDTAADPRVVPKSWINIYDIASSSWTISWNPANMADNSRRDFTAVTNPSNNQIYIMAGDAGPAGAIFTNVFNVYDTATTQLTEITTPIPGPQNITTYGAVWVPRLNNMLVIGGTLQGGSASSLFVYHPDTGAWTTQETIGPFNYARYSHCAAANADGSLVTVFGGFAGGSKDGDPNAYILDTTTWRWTTVPYNGRGRGNAACTVAGDTFMVWGGFENSPNTAIGVPQGADALLLLSLSSKTWQTTYIPSPDLSSGADNPNNPNNPGNPGTGGPNGDNGNNNNNRNLRQGISGAAIGGIVAGCVVLLLVIAFAMRERRRRRKKNLIPKTDSDLIGPDMREAEIRGQSSSKMDHHNHSVPPRPPIPSGRYNSLELAPETLKDHRGSADDGYNSSFGYSNPTTPTTLQFLNTGDHGEAQFGTGTVAAARVGGAAGRYERESYQSDGTSASTYYPPPPVVSRRPVSSDTRAFQTSMANNNTGVERRPNDPQAIVNHAITTQNEGYYPYNSTAVVAPTTAEDGLTAAATDQYHDTYGTRKHNSHMSSQSIFSDGSSSNPQQHYYDPKRPVSGPQGGFGIGATVEHSSPGAPQAILQQRQSFHHHSPTSPR